MFDSIWQAVRNGFLRLGSGSWPVTQGEVTDAVIDVFNTEDGPSERLFVTYKFYVGSDGPYTGGANWSPRWGTFGARRLLEAAQHEMHIGRPVRVRYRPEDPSLNELDGGLGRLLD